MAKILIEPQRLIAADVALKAEVLFTSTAANFGMITVYAAAFLWMVQGIDKSRPYASEGWAAALLSARKSPNAYAPITLLIANQRLCTIEML